MQFVHNNSQLSQKTMVFSTLLTDINGPLSLRDLNGPLCCPVFVSCRNLYPAVGSRLDACQCRLLVKGARALSSVPRSVSGPVPPAVTESPGPAPTGPRRPGSPPGPAARALPPQGPPASAGAAVAHQAGKYPDFTHTPAGPSQSESSSSWPGGLQVLSHGPSRNDWSNYAEITQIMQKLRRN